MAGDNEAPGLFSQFTKGFWIVNSLELFERGAYYGTMAVLGVHVVETLLGGADNAEAIWGGIYALLIILLYFIPLVSAALAEKYGYRPVLIAAFMVLIIGYFLLFFVKPDQLSFLIFALILLGIGAGAFKPIISASIAHITREEQRNLAYSIYYWMINLGAFLFPLMIGFMFPTKDVFHFIFLISTVLIGINIAISFFLYKDPVETQKKISVTKAISRIIPALKDKKFAILLLIYSGFWFMFAYNHTFLPVYMVQFGRMPTWFVVAWLATINPGTIIILGPYLGKLVEKYKSLNVMMLGILIFCLGLAINGFSNTWEFFVLGIIIFSIGEFITHPGFISYVSKIAPKDMVAIYMGCIFISTGLGNAVGGAMQGVWYSYFAKSLLLPKVYLSLVISVGLVTMVCFFLYNRWMISETLKLDPEAEVDRSIWTKPITAGIVLLFIPITIYGAYLGGPNTLFEDDEVIMIPADWDTDYSIIDERIVTIGEYSTEGSDYIHELSLSERDYKNIISLTFILTWIDEDPINVRYTNQPDDFQLLVSPPWDNSSSIESSVSSSGTITTTLSIFNSDVNKYDPFYNGTGEYKVTVHCDNCGDQVLRRPSGGVFTQPDNGNDWDLEISYKYYQKNET